MRVVSFADGFTSATAPSIGTAGQERYPLANNVTSLTSISALNFSSYTSAFIDFEVVRSDISGTKRQVGSFLLSKTSSGFDLNLGNYQGDDMIRMGSESVSLPHDLYFSVTSLGQIQYKSGNMDSGSHAGELKVLITRIF